MGLSRAIRHGRRELILQAQHFVSAYYMFEYDASDSSGNDAHLSGAGLSYSASVCVYDGTYGVYPVYNKTYTADGSLVKVTDNFRIEFATSNNSSSTYNTITKKADNNSSDLLKITMGRGYIQVILGGVTQTLNTGTFGKTYITITYKNGLLVINSTPFGNNSSPPASQSFSITPNLENQLFTGNFIVFFYGEYLDALKITENSN